MHIKKYISILLGAALTVAPAGSFIETFQIHNRVANETYFAFSDYEAADNSPGPGVGIGNSSGASSADPLFAEQWALKNNGDFQLQEMKQFPVYTDLDGSSIGPGFSSSARTGGRKSNQMFTSSTIDSSGGIDININGAWSYYEGGKQEVVIAMIDTGIDTSHEDFSDAFWTNPGEIPDNGIDDDGNGYVDDVHGWNFYHDNNQIFVGDEDSHGTHGAGSIAAKTGNGIGISGIMTNGPVKIMVLKALGGSKGGGTTEAIIEAVNYAKANGASICNLSLGSSHADPRLYQAIAQSEMLFVVAAGNDGMDSDKNPTYPACYDLDNIITVANLQPDGVLSSTTNYGAKSVDIAAPGTYILSLSPKNNYSYMTGSSMAAPLVTGVAAMIRSDYPELSALQLKSVLISSAHKLENLDGKIASGGMLDAGAAMKASKEMASGMR